MSRRFSKLFIVVATILLTSIFWLGPTFGQNSPSATALSTFEALRAAESSGADITGLVAQYNVLIQQSSPNSSFIALGQAAANAQQDAMALRSNNQILTLVLVPVTALIMALVAEGLLQLRRRVAREKLLDMEIKQL
jgi:hypothetical protein